MNKKLRMLNKADIKLVKSLGDKNIRLANKLFVAEGNKSVSELIFSQVKLFKVFALNSWVEQQSQKFLQNLSLEVVSAKELEMMSSLKSTREVLAVFEMPEYFLDPSKLKGLVMALDHIQDPGNLGTLIRVADWYGIKQVLCSSQTVDCYNPKVVQATMGSIGRVEVHYGNLAIWFKEAALPVIAGSMEGKASRSFVYPKNLILLIGNEGSGIQDHVKPLIHQTISIERYGKAESLNAAVAGALLVDRYFGQHPL